jgi:intein-encoded DNA endonuclease-like protein
LFGKKPKIILDKRDFVWSLMLNSKAIYDKIVRISNYPGTQIKWNTPEMVMNGSPETQKGYVKGFFDSEGGIPHVENERVEPKNMRISFTQNNKTCLMELKAIISSFGVKTGNVCGPYFKKGCKNPVYRLKIHGFREVARFFDIFGSLHPEKNLRLSLIKKDPI